MREIRQSGSEGGARFNPLSLPLSHLFESNAGSGAAGNGSGGVGGNNRSVKNPFRKETWNLTEQMKLQKTDPQLAARLKAAV